MKFKKILFIFVSALLVFVFVGCKKDNNKLDNKTLEKVRKELLTKNKFNFLDTLSKYKDSFEKINASEIVEDENFVSDSELLYRYDNTSKKYQFINRLTSKTFEFDGEGTNVMLTTRNYILLKKDDTFTFISRYDGKELLKVENATLTSSTSKNEIKMKHNANTFKDISIDEVKVSNQDNYDFKKYYFYKGNIIKDLEKFEKEILDYKNKEIKVNSGGGVATVYKDGKIYDVFNLPDYVSENFILENNNILFSRIQQIDYTYNQNDLKNYYFYGDKTYLYESYLYDFNKKTLKKINLQFVVEHIEKNQKDEKGNYISYKNSKIKNIADIRFIDPETRKLLKREKVAIDNYLTKITEVEDILSIEKINDNRYLLESSNFYSLVDNNKKFIRAIKKNKIASVHNSRYFVISNGLTISSSNRKVDIYDIVEDKYIARNYYIAKDSYSIDKNLNVFHDDMMNYYILTNNPKEVLVKVNGKEFLSRGQISLFLQFKDENNVYLYYKTGELIATNNATTKIDVYENNPFKDSSSSGLEYTFVYGYKFTDKDGKKHYGACKVSYKTLKNY